MTMQSENPETLTNDPSQEPSMPGQEPGPVVPTQPMGPDMPPNEVPGPKEFPIHPDIPLQPIA